MAKLPPGHARAPLQASAQQSTHQAAGLASQFPAYIEGSEHAELASPEPQARMTGPVQWIRPPQDLLQGALPARAWVLRQEQHWEGMMEGIAGAIAALGPDVTCLVLGDSPQLALMAARDNHISRVFCVLVGASYSKRSLAFHSAF